MFIVLINKIIKHIFYLFMVPIYLISLVVPRDKNIWIFGAWFGNKFSDNSKYLFLYVKNNQPNVRPIWLTKNKKVLKELRDDGYECYHANSLKGFYYSIRAGVAIVCQDIKDVNPFVLGRAKRVQLWHGTALKKIIFDDNNPRYLFNRFDFIKIIFPILKIVFPFIYQDFNFYIASSPETRMKFCSAFNVKPEKIAVTGYPRNDVLLNCDLLQKTDYESDAYGKLTEHKLVVTYLPTFRDYGLTFDQLFTNYNFDLGKVEEYFEDRDILFICKPHPADIFDNMVSINSNHINVLSDIEIPDLYPLLQMTDILITDYSSIYFDFLITNKPIVFAPFDLKEYITQSRSLYYDYELVTPGPKAYNWFDVISFIEEAILYPEKYQNERTSVNQIFNTYCDDQNTMRVYQEIVNLF